MNKIQSFKFGIILGAILLITFLILTISVEINLFYLYESYPFIIFSITALYIIISNALKFYKEKKKTHISFEDALKLDNFHSWVYHQVIERNFTRTQLNEKMKNSFLTEKEIELIWANVNLRISFCNPEIREKAKQKGIKGLLLILFGLLILIYDTDLFFGSVLTILIGVISSLTGYLENLRLSGDE